MPAPSKPQLIKTLIIGAGPGGLAVAGRLAKRGEPFEVIEMASEVGAAWVAHYDRLHLHTAKDLSALPHMAFPQDYPLYVSKSQLVNYMRDYASHFGIFPHFGERAVSVKNVGGKWLTTTALGTVFESDNVVVGTGFNRVPVVPKWPGMDLFEGALQHARDYKNGAAFAGKRVLVVGMGNTGAELALDLHEHGAVPFISARGPVNVVLRDFLGKPTQYTAVKLQRYPTWVSDMVSTVLQKIMVGDLSKYGLQRPRMAPSKQLRELGKTPVIDLGTVDLIKKGAVGILPGIKAFNAHSVVFTDGHELEFDAVILATGYQSRVADFIDDMAQVLNHLGEPKAPVIPGRSGLYFIGFGAYAGGILRSIHMNSKQIVEHLLERQTH